MMRRFSVYCMFALSVWACRSRPKEVDKSTPSPHASASAAKGDTSAIHASSASSRSPDASAVAPEISPPAPAKVVGSTLTIQPHTPGNPQCPFVLHNPRGAVVVAECQSLSLLQDGGLREAKLPTTGFGVNHFTGEEAFVHEVHRVTGRWPDALVVEVTRWDAMQSDRGGYFSPQVSSYELVGGRWREVLDAATPQAAAWSQGRTLILRKNQFELMAGRKDLSLPERAPNPGDCGASSVSDFAAMADGMVVTAGVSCDEPRRLHSEIIEEGKPGVDYELKSATRPLEKATPRIVGEKREALFIVVPAARGVILWQFQNTGFVELGVPSKLPLLDAHVTSNGELWLAFNGPTKDKGKGAPAQLYRRMPSGTWESIALPSSEALHAQVKNKHPEKELRFVPGSIASFADGQVWLAGTVLQGVDEPIGSLLARAGNEAVLTAPAVGARPGPETPEPYRSSCESPFVILFSVGDAVPADFSFPSTRDALRGSEFLTNARFVEFRYKEKRTLGALVPSGDAGKALIERLKTGVRGSKPQLMCFAPKSVVREVALK